MLASIGIENVSFVEMFWGSSIWHFDLDQWELYNRSTETCENHGLNVAKKWSRSAVGAEETRKSALDNLRKTVHLGLGCT